MLSSINLRVGTEGAHKTLSKNLSFGKNRPNEYYALSRGVNEIMSVIWTILFLFGLNYL